MARIGRDGWWSRLRRHAVGIAVFAVVGVVAALAGLTDPGTPWWAPSTAFLATSALIASTYAHFWRPSRRELHLRAAVHVAGLALPLHLAGWGALLVPAYLLVASDLQRTSGRPVGRVALGWAVAVTAVGQAGVVLLGWPSVVPPEVALPAAAAGLLVSAVVTLRLEGDEQALLAATVDADAREARLQGVLEDSRDAVVVLGDGRPVLSSPRVAELLQLVEDEHVVEQLGHRVHPDDAPRLAGLGTALRSTGRERVRLRRADDTWVEVDVTWRVHPATGETVLRLQDRTDADELREQLARVADVDVLTGLSNRRWLGRRLPALLGAVSRHRRPAALLYVDLDGFKAVNDQRGHAHGDEVLRHVARAMAAAVREHDGVARIGGDEFVVLLEELVDEAEACTVAQRVLDAVAACGREHGAALRASVGVRVLVPGDDAAGVLVDADGAMYFAKRAGGGRFALHEPGQDAGARSVRRQPRLAG